MAYRASTLLPHDDLERGGSGAAGRAPPPMLYVGDPGLLDWSTLAVTGPEIAADERGRP